MCGEQVYFYQSRDGGRVFFNDVGWPWPKHECTDKKAAQTGAIRTPLKSNRRAMYLRDEHGIQLDFYEFTSMSREGSGLAVCFTNMGTRRVFYSFVTSEQMKVKRLIPEDFGDAPSFLLTPYLRDRSRRAQFICVRLRQIVTVEITRSC